MKEIFKFAALTGFVYTLIYLTFFKEIEQAGNILHFWIWFMFILSMIAVVMVGTDPEINPDRYQKALDRVTILPIKAVVFSRIPAIIVLVWFSWEWTAIAACFTLFFIYVYRLQVERVLKLYKEVFEGHSKN